MTIVTYCGRERNNLHRETHAGFNKVQLLNLSSRHTGDCYFFLMPYVYFTYVILYAPNI